MGRQTPHQADECYNVTREKPGASKSSNQLQMLFQKKLSYFLFSNFRAIRFLVGALGSPAFCFPVPAFPGLAFVLKVIDQFIFMILELIEPVWI